MLLLTVYVLVVVSSLRATVSSSCSFVTQESFPFEICGLKKHNSIEIAGRRVPVGTENVRIRLEKPSREIIINCQRHHKYYSWRSSMKDGNQVRISFYSDYFVRAQVYWCDSFDGPKNSTTHCAVEAFSSVCPGIVGDNHTCVYKVQTRSFSSKTVRNAVEVSTEVAAVIRQKVQVSSGVSYTHERVQVNTYTIDRQSYIFIPAGYRFCSFSEALSVEDYLSATGYSWRCKAPTFVQTTIVNGRCTDLTLCEARSPCPAFNSDNQGNRATHLAKSTVAQPLVILLLFVISGST